MHTNRFALMLEAMAELEPEIAAARRAQETHLPTPRPALPSLDKVLAETGPLPRAALYLGTAADGLPVLLDLRDPLPGPLLVAGDPGSGKTALLRTIALAAARMHSPEAVQFGVITGFPDEWSDFGQLASCAGIFPLYENAAQDFLISLAAWAHANKTGSQSVLLLLDDFEAALRLDFDALQNLRWLLLRGPARHVWPIVTLDAGRINQVLPWLEAFRTRIFGRIRNSSNARQLTGVDDAGMDTLLAGVQFSLREGRGWLRFWIPNLGMSDSEEAQD